MEEKRRPVVRVRVEADCLVVEEVATLIGELLAKEGYELIDQSGLFPSAHKDGEGKVHLTVR